MTNIKPVIRFFFLILLYATPLASQEKTTIGGKDYYLHQVKKGEGFYRLSITYGVSQKEIVDANSDLALTGLKEGAVVKVPVVKRLSENTSTSGFLYHTVEKGQTLFFISRKYEVSIDQIQQLNPETRQGLVEGAMLKIPVKNESVAGPMPAPDSRYREHVVAPGETLYKIAGQYQITLRQLSEANPSLVESALKPGARLRIPQVVPVAPPEDETFRYHVVLNGESLFALAQKYEVDERQIVLANEPTALQPLPVGQVVRIPKQTHSPAFQAPQMHVVKKKETLYGIGRQYNVSIDDLKKANPTLDWSSLKKGDEVKIPGSHGSVQNTETSHATEQKLPDEAFSTACDTYNYRQEGAPPIRVALLLPFDLAAHQSARLTPDSLKTSAMRTQANKSKAFVEFYEGALLALDTLKEQGAHILWHVYDTTSDSLNLNALLNRPEMAKMNLLIGPAYISQMKQVAQYAQEKQIPVVFPFTPYHNGLRSNPFVFQASPVDTLLQEPILNRLMKSSGKKRIILLSTGSTHAFETRVGKEIKQLAYRKNLPEGVTPDFVELRYNPRDLTELEVLLSKEKENLLIIPSVEEAKVSRMLTTLGALADRTKAPLSVFGFSEWLKFQTIEAEDLHKLNTFIYSPFGVDYHSEEVRKFSANYRKWYNAEPVAFNPYFQSITSQSRYSRYGMWGYDVTNYFVGALMTYGPQFAKCLHQYRPALIQSQFEFVPITNWGGSYNKGLVQIHFTKDFQTRVTSL